MGKEVGFYIAVRNIILNTRVELYIQCDCDNVPEIFA